MTPAPQARCDAPQLAPDAIHVWTVRLDRPAPAIELPPEERARIDAAATSLVRQRREKVRTALRRVLGAYAGQDPAMLQFGRGTHGKPHLIPEHVAFNLSHTEDLMLLAIAGCGALGIDVDRLDRLEGDWRPVARAILSPDEWPAISALPAGDRSTAVMRLWVRKEAYTKALGTGFAHGFTAVTVWPSGDRRRVPVRDQRSPAYDYDWTLIDLPATPPFGAALAYHGGGRRVEHFTL
ncbi:4'-phosphopantetheinyl transferase family protein [Methylobacterium sp. D54C]